MDTWVDQRPGIKVVSPYSDRGDPAIQWTGENFKEIADFFQFWHYTAEFIYNPFGSAATAYEGASEPGVKKVSVDLEPACPWCRRGHEKFCAKAGEWIVYIGELDCKFMALSDEDFWRRYQRAEQA